MPSLLPLILMALACAGSPVMAAEKARPYVEQIPRPDMMRVLPPPPAPGSPADQDDRATFRETRKLAGGDRWMVATRDVTDGPFISFACAMGLQLSPASAPALARIFDRMGGGLLINPVKQGYARRRPYLNDDLPICEPKTDHLASNGDYPSGHTTSGWSTALVLAELLPERATPLLARGRAFGESRFICGSHSKSAVEAGYLSGASLVAMLHASPEFRRDMEAARAELKRLGKAAPRPSPSQCALEAKALDMNF
ncbi:MAG: phosphatase PAP2 family protein [Sphingobium sp.]